MDWKIFFQAVISIAVLIFCMYKLDSASGTEQLALYWGGITGILGYWLPSPSSK